ncbi:MAG: hypothetical protein E7211_00355 [Clostridium lundense]|nr:hypothetical protein [Clostridium lundense]
MSKLYIRLNYKNACILKHALRNQIELKELNTMDVDIKELEEEKRALEAITNEIKRCGFMHNTQVFG